MDSTVPAKIKLTTTQWLICIIAVIGFAFDIYELLMLPLIVRPALMEMIGAAPGSVEFGMWVGRLFYIPAICGGLFGLLGGWLTDRLGRRRVLTYSILLYAFGAFAAGFSTTPWMLLFFRCLVFVGVCVEFVAAVAWLAELFPNPHQREQVLGYTQAFSSIGGLLVAVVNGLAITYAANLPALGLPDWLNFFGGEIQDGRAPWRYTLISGLIPAIPLIIIRPFLPESPAWQAKKSAGTLKRPSIAQLFNTPRLRRATIVTTIMFALAYAAAFGAIQHIQRIIPGLPEIKAEGQAVSEAAVAQALAEGTPAAAAQGAGVRAARLYDQAAAAKVTKVQEVGGLYGRFIFAVLAGVLLARGVLNFKMLLCSLVIAAPIIWELVTAFHGSLTDHLLRIFGGAAAGAVVAVITAGLVSLLKKFVPPTARGVIRIFQVPGLIVMPLVFAYAATHDLQWTMAGMFLAGLLTVGQFSFWGNYLPRVYPLHLRGTGESFAANIGGRMIGTSFAWVTSTLATTTWMPGGSPTAKLAMTAAIIGFLVYLGGFIASFWLPEPKEEDLAE